MAENVTHSFRERLDLRARRTGSLLCVGLDPDPTRFPSPLRGGLEIRETIIAFNGAIIEATQDLVCAYKPNLGFYLAHGPAGIEALAETRRMIPAEIPVILDAKIGDIRSTSDAYARGIFDTLGFDAVTLNPYLGEDALEPFMSRPDRGVFVLCKTSNLGGGEVQDLAVIVGGDGSHPEPGPLYRTIAERVGGWAERAAATVGLVVGATYAQELAEVRERAPRLPILLPGVGAQRGDVAAAVRAGLDADGGGLVVTASRSVLYAGDEDDFRERARGSALRLRDEVNRAR